MKFKKLTALMLTAVLGIGALTSCSSGDETSSADADALTYVSLRINPEIELRDKSMSELKELLPEESNKNDKSDKNDKNNKK